MKVSSVKVRLSLQRAKDSFETVYVGVKPGQMLLDLMMRMDSAHIKVEMKMNTCLPFSLLLPALEMGLNNCFYPLKASGL